MSTTYTLVCDDCRKKYWAGQASYCGHYLYDNEALANFMFDHAEHILRFLNDNLEHEAIYDYENVEK